MTSRWSRRRKLRKMVEAAESDILRHFKEMVAEKHNQNGNAQVKVKRPQVAEESGVSHCCHPGIDSQVFTSRYEQISEVCETYVSPDKDNDCDRSFPPQHTDSRHHNAPPSFRHLSPLRQNTQNDTALQSPQHAESDVEDFFIDDATSQKMLTMLSDLTRAVNELREEVRAIRHPCCNESVDAGVLPLDLPLHNIEELNNAEAALQSQEANKAMVRRFALIGGTTLEGLCHYKRAGLGTKLGREKNQGPDKAKKGI
ncbi:uncharacterized protein LOC102205371 [Pundamilia nyererei]|uniref:Uncharacterized protein LOC102205371 n=1 Tax=Pundamilia nyererei TaxID=303518 RepID=A0A9Y3VPD7_9CICH|nr:PREDICTED: uncharacterized protein LOC102205371 [Pundamilia nyererei]XP_013769573.1 PREDICTED: uncharacterized protein LOC102205371 [Pundamilia nyererei]